MRLVQGFLQVVSAIDGTAIDVDHKMRFWCVNIGRPGKVPSYNNCLRILEHLWKIFCVIWKRGKNKVQWRVAEGIWVPKEEDGIY